jgi:hypothetical protein
MKSVIIGIVTGLMIAMLTIMVVTNFYPLNDYDINKSLTIAAFVIGLFVIDLLMTLAVIVITAFNENLLFFRFYNSRLIMAMITTVIFLIGIVGYYEVDSWIARRSAPVPVEFEDEP